MQQLGGLYQMNRGKIFIKKNCQDYLAQNVPRQSPSPSQQSVWSTQSWTKLPAFLQSGQPKHVNIFQMLEKINSVGRTKSTLPTNLSDKLGTECALDLAEPMYTPSFPHSLLPSLPHSLTPSRSNWLTDFLAYWSLSH